MAPLDESDAPGTVYGTQRVPAGAARARPGDSRLAERLRKDLRGEVLFDAASRGRYSTDASIYQIEPLGVVVPAHVDDVFAALAIAREEGVPVLPRGGGTSQCGQTVGRCLVIDTSKHLRRVLSVDTARRTCWVEPGITLDVLNAGLRKHGLWFPVDISTGSRGTIGGMAGNNSCGSRSIRYGNMVHNTRAIDMAFADGSSAQFGEVPESLAGQPLQPRYRQVIEDARRIVGGVADELAGDRWPRLLRRVGGYNLDMIQPHVIPGLGRNEPGHNMAKLLVGSEGTLGFFTRLQLDLSPIPKAKTLGICHFPSFYQAMDATQHIVKLDPDAVELVDRTMIELARDIAIFRPVVDRFVQGEPDAVLLVEFAGDTLEPQMRKLRQLVELMGDLGFPGSVVEATDPKFQSEIWEVRKQGLNIMMSMKGDGKPVSFIEDCAVPLPDLAEYTRQVDDIFRKHGTKGTWYAHASVGTLHVRPIINVREGGAKTMRAIAEEAFELVRRYKGAHSGEHGDGLVRSEFHEPMYGSHIVRAFEAIKDSFDPDGLMNPGKIVRPPRMDDRTLMRFPESYAVQPMTTALDWSAWGGLGGAVEMCNNNGECRKFDAGTMCPSYRVTRDEQHLTRGRANTLRLAITGQLGPDALTSDALASEAMKATMDLCVACKGCKRECPTGVDMARMKIEFKAARAKRHGLSLREKLIAYLPRYAHWGARLAPLMNLRNRVPALAQLGERWLGLAAKRSLPEWRRDTFLGGLMHPIGRDGRPEPQIKGTVGEVVLFADTFNNSFEAENLHAALHVLEALRYTVHVAIPADGSRRPLCCGRTFLAEGLVDEARAEQQRLIGALKPYAERGLAIVGLEPSCLFTLKDELAAVIPGADATLIGSHAMLFEEFLAAEHKAGRLDTSKLKPLPQKKALLHGHCHQKAFAAMGAVETVLRLIPELQVETITSSCCGMAGAFGYEAEHVETSLQMAELALLPAIRNAAPDTLLVADGTSCRHQIKDGTSRDAAHVARILAASISAG
ncbi:MAG: FAD-binding protein [Alphaproteobacteria bacterium]|nr:FAD-binding protein [Alphaproteobacteria bacterium]